MESAGWPTGADADRPTGADADRPNEADEGDSRVLKKMYFLFYQYRYFFGRRCYPSSGSESRHGDWHQFVGFGPELSLVPDGLRTDLDFSDYS